MDPKHLEELIAVEGRYWWHVAKRGLVTEVLRRHVPPPGRLVEGGIGGGSNLLAFRGLGYEVSGFDLMEGSVAHCRAIGLDDVRVHDLQEPWPAPRESARAVVLLDVIEHVAEPVRVLRHAAEILEPGGAVVVTVPAAPYLMGPWDRMLGHHRRYSARLLEEHARGAGLRAAFLSHWNAFTLPAALVVRTVEKLTGGRRSAEFPRVSPATNRALLALAAAERRVIARARLGLGLSLIGVLTHEREPAAGPPADRRGPHLGRHPGVQRGPGARDVA